MSRCPSAHKKRASALADNDGPLSIHLGSSYPPRVSDVRLKPTKRQIPVPYYSKCKSTCRFCSIVREFILAALFLLSFSTFSKFSQRSYFCLENISSMFPPYWFCPVYFYPCNSGLLGAFCVPGFPFAK